MYTHLSLPLYLLAIIPFSDASLFSRTSDSVMRTANNARHNAVKRSKDFARDLQLAYAGMFAANQEPLDRQTKLYCVNSAPVAGGRGGSVNGSASTTLQPSGTQSVAAPAASGSSSSPWTLAQSYEGNNFFNGWDFQTGPDSTTGGAVTYVDLNTGNANNLTEINSAGNAVMRVETTPTVSSSRMSVRITTTYTFTLGLLIMDSVHMPTGCGTWPAFWTDGPNWPAGGEIDIVEGVNTYTANQATLHTNPGCTIASSDTSVLNITGTLIDGTDCAAADTGNAGCGVRATQSNTFGSAFNSNGGGVYAMEWTNDGIKVFFFPRSSIPSDITAGAPLPDTWGKPMASWPASTCNATQFFYNNNAIFDTTLCGQWAGSVWTSSGPPGQAESCAQMTGVGDCVSYVLANGSAFDEAYWEVTSVKIYQLAS